VGRAHERLACTARRRLDTRAAVAADVQERAQLAVVAAHHEQRHAGGIVREEVTRRGELRDMTHDERQLAKQPCRLIGVRVDGYERRGRLGVGGAVVEVCE
jgi:hypothetical protein